jgi:pyridoxamine 5'-phosphate oxidase
MDGTTKAVDEVAEPDRTGIFEGADPIVILRRWLAEAERSEPNDANAMTLATVDADGMPNARIVLLKEVGADGLFFYTNHESDKGRELDAAPRAALVLHWKSLRRQVRVRGPVERADGARADAYYASRGLGSRIGAWASRQSRPLGSRADLEHAVDAERQRHGEAPERPDFWGGYRIDPMTVEFWADGRDRLHDRFRWIRRVGSDTWSVIRLNP